ncbi:hypothetical protein Bbelb_278530 [Branchiostoma belcheri]|nr:hypothetical protein Bbelb_278530 [Branchiostoma belcheri]
MWKKLRHVLILLLVILKEPNMTKAVRNCAPQSHRYRNQGLTSIPQNLSTSIYELSLRHNLIKTLDPVDVGKNPWQCDCKMACFRLKMDGSASFENPSSNTNTTAAVTTSGNDQTGQEKHFLKMMMSPHMWSQMVRYI